MWYLRFRSSGKLARFYSSPTHHWCYSSSQLRLHLDLKDTQQPDDPGNRTFKWISSSIFANLTKSSAAQQCRFTSKLKWFQESTKSWLKSSYQFLTNIMLTLHYTSLSRMSSSPSLHWLFSYFRCEATESGLESAQMQFLMLRNPSHMSLSTSNPLWEAQKEREREWW